MASGGARRKGATYVMSHFLDLLAAKNLELEQEVEKQSLIVKMKTELRRIEKYHCK